MTSMPTRFYLLGYTGYLLPRSLRRLLARTKLHRAWLAGDMGVFREARGGAELFCGVCDRKSFHPRKGPNRAIAKPQHIVANLMFPFGW
ncbi:hypothetical protein [Pseudomonas sp. MWU12-2323]|uniref:hypothetical protein n=1 Tax=Pseudomonas sp. MWU12-2323 TaxID=2651296 RepID=UPI00128B75C4|nr:hypothetical protein [Pseudomonas sp. MWU12-2323]MPQ69427.1 hypothetical protein [Pseudomonas sp. MWU12-2323]